jgi:hypothetical protein
MIDGDAEELVSSLLYLMKEASWTLTETKRRKKKTSMDA